MPSAGGEYVFLREAFHPVVGFLYGWTLLWVIGSGAVAVLAVACCEYVVRLTPWLGMKVGPLALVLVLLLTGYHAVGLRPGLILINVLTVVKIAALVALVAAAFLAPEQSGDLARSPLTREPVHGLLGGLLAALLPVMYAYSGWQKLSHVSEEVVRPSRNLPRAIICGVALVIVLYVAANLAYLKILGSAGLASTNTPALDLAAVVWGHRGARLMGLIVVASMFSSLNLALMTTPRVYYAMARDGLFLPSMGRIHKKTHVPTTAVVLQGGVGAALAATGSFAALVDYKVFGEWVFLMLSGIVLVVMRHKAPNADRPMPAPLYPYIPIGFSLAGVAIIAGAFVANPHNALGGVAVVVCGIPAFYLFARHSTRRRVGWPRP